MLAGGEVLNAAATVAALDAGQLGAAVIDVWAPGIDADLMDRAFLVSPHIAGHSFEGKINGTIMLYEQACTFFDIPPVWDHYAGSRSTVETINGSAKNEAAILETIRQVYDIREDDARFRDALGMDDQGRLALFKQLRSNYPLRHEFQRYAINCAPEDKALFSKLGFQGAAS